MAVKAVCFDIDGTLYPKGQTGLKLMCSFWPSPRLAYHYRRFRKAVREEVGIITVPENQEGFRRRQAAWILEDMGRELTGNAVSTMEKRIEKQFYSCWKRSFSTLKPYQGIREAMLRFQSKGCRLGILSDFPVEEKLKTLGVADLIDFFCCSEDAGYLKPHPKPFHLLARNLEVGVEEIVYVGDSYHKDIVGAAGVGMKTCLITSKANRNRLKAGWTQVYHLAGCICADYMELTKMVENMIDGGV
jgi:putative hydrolase of the HAD superfamily